MIIRNLTDDIIFEKGQKIGINEQIQVNEHIFDTIYINSNVGSAVITCEYKDRFIECFGDIVVRKNDEEDVFDIMKI